MKVLLDTHTVFWWWMDDPRLTPHARRVIANPANVVMVSAVSAFEVSTKHRIGKWPDASKVLRNFQTSPRRSRFVPLDVTLTHGLLAGALDASHKDPFDRLLVAQSRIEEAPIVSADTALNAFRIERIWDEEPPF